LSAVEIARASMEIAAGLCIYTNDKVILLTLGKGVIFRRLRPSSIARLFSSPSMGEGRVGVKGLDVRSVSPSSYLLPWWEEKACRCESRSWE